MRRISIDEAQPGMRVGQAILTEEGEMLLNVGVELISRYIASLRARGYSSLVIDDEATQGIKVPETISTEVRAATTQKLKETFAAFGQAADDLKGKGPREIAKGLESQTYRDQAKRIDPYQAMIDKAQAMIDDLLTVSVLDGLNAVKIHDDYTFEHSVNVTVTSLLIGQQLQLAFFDAGEQRARARRLLRNVSEQMTRDRNRETPLPPRLLSAPRSSRRSRARPPRAVLLPSVPGPGP